ncbi:ClC family H(+)/Cl(-) exchange transporter [Breznakiellaceae bacterium SP9]
MKLHDPLRKVRRQWFNSRLALIFESLLIGLAAGLVVVFFRSLLAQADSFRYWLYARFAENPMDIVLWVGVLAVLGVFLGWTSLARPLIKGSGIPQVKGVLLDKIPQAWFPELPLKLLTGFAGMAAGLSLGREGPSIQIAAFVGMGMLPLFKRPKEQEKILICAASSAGLSAAFSAPLSGVLFVLEELQPQFSPVLISCVMGASMVANFTAAYFFKMRPVFDFRSMDPLTLEHIPWIILLGIICAVLGDLFKRALYTGQDLYKHLHIPPLVRPIIPLLASIPIGIYCIEILGGGHSLIESLSIEDWSVAFIAILFAGKLLFTALCYGSGTAGGIFLPLLSLGALCGAGLGKLLLTAGLLQDGHDLNFLVLGMAAFFTAVVKSPVTGIILILEMSGNLNHLGTLVLVAFSTLLVSDILASSPVYVVLLGRLLGTPKPPTG